VRRREFITLIGGAAAASSLSWPHAARAQQSDRMRRIGVLIALAENDPEGQTRVSGFERRLQELGWTAGRNLRIEYRWAAGAGERTRAMAAELVATAPEVVLADGYSAVAALRRESATNPIIFVQVPDPVGIGVVPNLARPGGNITGFTHYEYAMPGKWLELLKEIAPRIERVLVLRRDATPGPGRLAYAAVEAVARSLRVQASMAIVLGAADIERALDAAAREPNVGLIPLPTTVTSVHRDLIVALAARNRMPAAYPYRHFVTAGGLLSYGIDSVHQFRQAADYIDRVLKGANPGDLPVQAPTKFELVINLKTAKALGLDVPPTLLARADEAIE
jgi:putative ABC transport system substrate-binding protein